ncbi:ABC transporter ATP-binding protein [Paracoccus albus]|uniref:ABC transporter ATP-binding protein n=1 Tax=Paracoccus albus TaxID=3017784 RepID=UPI0022F0AB41|nr:ABC transporter ATP-binding protein [Paracoccus albus]WBU58952.1 ABC transporter ATP-binding protein [Paracoccus albus]
MLKISALTKTFGPVPALDDVTLSVASGQRVALLGHNGAGKSTLMKIVLGLIGFDGGAVEVIGGATGDAEVRNAVAYLPENVSFHPALTGREQIAHYLRLRQKRSSSAGDLLARVGLADALDRRIGTYSKGMRQRVGLAQALIGSPKLMLLDEPTSGLDPVSRRSFYDLLDDLSRQGTAILLSSHALTEVEAQTDSIIILSQGRVVAEGSIKELRQQAVLPVTIRVTPSPDAHDTVLSRFPDARNHDGRLCFHVTQKEKMPLLRRLTEAGDSVADIDIAPPSLEDIYSYYSAVQSAEEAA